MTSPYPQSRVRDLRAAIVRLEQMMDVELDPGSDFYHQLGLLFRDMRALLINDPVSVPSHEDRR
jgi:hypothetical protein